MNQRRIELDRILRNLLGSSNVYYQPPTGTRMQYPCIVYKLATGNDIFADNRIYRRLYRYSLTYITKDPDDPMRDNIDDLQYCTFDTMFVSDNLNHYTYTLYY